MPSNYSNGVSTGVPAILSALTGGMGFPQSWGAVGNGTTDDTTATQALINNASGLYVPPNTVLYCSQLTITKAYFKIWGGGMIQLKAGSNSPLLFVDGSLLTGGTHLTIENVIFDGNKANQTAAAPLVQLRNASFTRITDSWVQNSYGDGLAIENYGGSTVANEINVLNSFFLANGGNGINLYSTLASSLISPTGDHVIKHCHLVGNGGDGILLQGAADLILAHNHILSNTGSGIEGTGISGQFNLTRCEIASNSVRLNGNSGLYLHQAGANGAERIQIVGGRFHYNNAAVSGTSDGIDIANCNGLTLNGVYSGDADQTARQPYGIKLTSCTNVAIIGCHLADNLTAALLATGVTYGAYGNIGLEDEVGY